MKSLEKKNFSINVHVKARSYMFVPAKYASAEVPVLEHPVLIPVQGRILRERSTTTRPVISLDASAVC